MNNITEEYTYARGIYSILNTVTGKEYIGKAQSIFNRIQDHERQLETNCHHSILLQEHYKEYGSDSFVASVILLLPYPFTRPDMIIIEGNYVLKRGFYNSKKIYFPNPSRYTDEIAEELLRKSCTPLRTSCAVTAQPLRTTNASSSLYSRVQNLEHPKMLMR